MVTSSAQNKFCEVQLRLNELHFESYMLTDGRIEESETRSDNTDWYMVAKVRCMRCLRCMRAGACTWAWAWAAMWH